MPEHNESNNTQLQIENIKQCLEKRGSHVRTFLRCKEKDSPLVLG